MDSIKAMIFWLFALGLLGISMACLSNGICGGSGGGCLPPPPPVCGSPCGAGMACGQYGCYRVRRARARSSNTIAVGSPEATLFGPNRFAPVARPGLSAAIQPPAKLSPDEAFMSCCESRGLPDACLQKCNFATYTKESLMSMYFRTDACPLQAAAEIQFCAAQGRDHTDCCARNGVTTTMSGEKCLTFCDQRPGNVTQLDFTYVSCYDRFEQMKACFWHGANGAY